MTAADTLDAATIDRIDSFLRERLREDELPGLSLAVTDGDELLYAQGYGSRDLAANDPATPDTVYGIGSVSKSFAALAVAQLVDAGELEYDDAATDYLDIDVPDDVTLHHLLSHTSGYPSLAASEALIARQMEVGESNVPLGSMDDVYAHIEGARDEIAGEPGEHWQYCNSGYTLAGEVVEAVSDESFTDYVEGEILEPLRMERSTYDEETYTSFDDRMTPYFPGDEDDDEDADLEPAALPIREQSAAAGGLLAPVTDLASYLRLHLNGGVTDTSERLLGEDTLSQCYGAYADTPSGPYGYGWRTREVCGHDLIGHGGSIAVSTAAVGFAPEQDLGIALLANASPGYGLTELSQAVFAALVGEDPSEIPFFARRQVLESLAGEYETYRGIKEAEVVVESGALRLRVGGPIEEGSWTPLVPTDLESGEFYVPTVSGERQPVRFEGDGVGAADGGDVSLFIDRWHLHKQ
ncbi:beta-lactamase domain protein [Natrialba magadii ATCC 43099]|uniref:Beta-lactamase n=1 Tax=Natrialba magadii (strain ATCC 43099 / DSM 3394 / CCM 3739 / CIP 104546 / IAM 13178 / JCM 8861 / NBRC 102185 / NCIMB 2190 / MS3) TaxID=547559 RepID=D3SY48_NATMM|nr:serine hydrolase [Natrialba magadii]ADD06019.1 beta-lactamase domain protein [Natrialba magadii ATCC 43099]ELY30472.1 beta-lactamase [Natrialba magadii ATCC 43099]